MRVRLTLVTVLMSCLFIGEANGDVLEEIYKHPSSDVAEYYKKNKAKITDLAKTVLNAQNSPTKRLVALRKLRLFPDAAIRIAEITIKAENVEVARYSARIVSTALVMSDHKMRKSARHLPTYSYMMKKHMRLKKVLRKSIEDSRQSLSFYCARTLASLSDKKAIQKIAAAVEAKTFKQSKAVECYSLDARGEGGKKLYEMALNSTYELEARRSAVANLARKSPSYSTRIETKILFNENQNLKIRIAAAEVLAKKPSVAITLLSNPKTPPLLHGTSLLTYVKAGKSDFNKFERKCLLEGLASYSDVRTIEEKDLQKFSKIRNEIESLLKDR